MTPSRTLNRTLLLGAFVFAVCSPQAVLAHGSGKKLKADPFVFVGKANVCDTSYPEGSNIVTSAWLGGLGLPDDGSLNSQGIVPGGEGPSPRDRHTGLLLSKNGPNGECASAGARIKGWRSGDTVSQLGFDYRNGGHCTEGAPRFNIISITGDVYFTGCGNGVGAVAPQDPAWTRVLIDQDAQVFTSGANPLAVPFAFGPTGTQVRSITILYDEGTQLDGAETVDVGLTVIDNINIGGKYIMKGRGIEPESDGEGHHH